MNKSIKYTLMINEHEIVLKCTLLVHAILKTIPKGTLINVYVYDMNTWSLVIGDIINSYEYS